MLETTKEPSPDMDEDVNRIKNPNILLLRGSRSANVGDYEDAVQSFARASNLLVKKHGELAYECAEAYLGYGKALLEHYRQKSNPIDGTAFNNSSWMSKYTKPMFVEDQYDDDIDVNKDNNEEEDGDKDKEGGDNSEEAQEGSSTSTSQKTKDADPAIEKAEKKVAKAIGDDENNSGIKLEKNNEEKKDQEQQQEGEKEQEEQVEGEDQEDDNEEEENEEAEEETADKDNDLEVAWESLEVAKAIFNKSEKNTKNKHYLAETLVALGDISLENEQFSVAIEDMSQAFDLMIDLLSTDYVVYRDLAEVVFKLGTAYQLNYEINNAITCFNKSKGYLNDRLQEIKADSIEHAEIIKIIEEIDEKIADSAEMKNNYFKILAKAKNEPGCSSVNSGASSSSSSAVPGPGPSSLSSSSSTMTSSKANDITHLVKRKRPDDNGDSKSDNRVTKQFKSE